MNKPMGKKWNRKHSPKTAKPVKKTLKMLFVDWQVAHWAYESMRRDPSQFEWMRITLGIHINQLQLDVMKAKRALEAALKESWVNIVARGPKIVAGFITDVKAVLREIELVENPPVVIEDQKMVLTVKADPEPPQVFPLIFPSVAKQNRPTNKWEQIAMAESKKMGGL